MNKAKVLALSLILAIMTMYMPACAQEVEAGDFTGVLNGANNGKIIVSNAQETREFVTDSSTQYDMGGASSFSTSDVVTVKYHSKGKTLVAEELTVKKHVQKDLMFSGTVTGLEENKNLTVTSHSLTVTFAYDSSTTVDGKLAKGDEVRITYVGNISEFPAATKIVVTKEVQEEPEKLTVSGIVSEASDTSLLLSLDSAHSRKFTLNKDTKISGVADKIKVGDSVNVTFLNTEDAAPVAIEVNIVKETTPQVRTVNGTIKSVGSSAISLKTDDKTYTFVTDKNTKYKGVKPAVGCKAEVTYSEVNGKNLASTVYCQKAPEKGVTAKGTVVSWGNGHATISIDGTGKTDLTYTNKLEKASDYTPQADDYVQITYMKSSKELNKIELIKRPDPPQPTPEEPVIAEGVVASWDDGKCTITVDGSDLNLTYTSDLDISPGYKPQAKDEVKIAYTKSDSVLRKIELENRPVPPQPIAAEGTLSAWGIDGQNKCTVETADGTLELTYDPDSLDIPTGYMPQADDSVKITYTAADMVLRSIQLINRPDHDITAEGTLTGWGTDQSHKCTVDVGGEVLTLTYDPESLDIPSGYWPKEGDYVSITYNSNDNVMSHIELIKRPDAPADEKKSGDDQQSGDDKKSGGDQPSGDDKKSGGDDQQSGGDQPSGDDQQSGGDDQQPADEPAPAPAPEPEPEPEPEPAPAPAPEPEPEPEPAPAPQPVLVTDDNATIVSGDEGSKSCKIKLSNGDTISLKVSGDTDIASGYFPQAGDNVSVTYDKDSMAMTKIQLISRPAPAADDGGDA